MVHPEVPAILLTPICPHTLSFRPMLLPESMVIKIIVPEDSRGGAWASFDGRHRIELEKGDAIVVSGSKYPFSTICKNRQTDDWFESLTRCLKWNERSSRQTGFGNNILLEDEINIQ
jgi:NAD+ kinase